MDDAVRGVAPDTSAAALAELEDAGVHRIVSSRIEDSGERPAPAYDEHGNPIDEDD